jgi:hypothetical protein
VGRDDFTELLDLTGPLDDEGPASALREWRSDIVAILGPELEVGGFDAAMVGVAELLG